VRKRPGRGYWIVAGAHRLSAARKLKWKTIDCIFLKDCTEDAATLIEIDENLIRAELSPAEKAMHVGERKAVYERLHPKTKNGGDRTSKHAKSEQNEKSAFCSDTAEKTNRSRRSVEIDAARAKVLGDDLKRVTGTSLDKGVELDALAKLEPQERAQIIERAEAGEKVSAVVEKNTSRKPPKNDALVEQALRLVAQMTDAERKLFLSKLEAYTKPTVEPSPRKASKPTPDTNVVKQAGNFHIEVMNYAEEFCVRVKTWHAANKIDEESHDCVVQALEMASMRLQQTAQDIDGRSNW
jgi:hypothetical protein